MELYVRKISTWILLGTIVIGILFSFRNLTQTFFQQDEWQYFGSSIYSMLSSNPFANILLPLQGKITHFFPLATAFFLLEYLTFKMNFSYYVLVSLIFHIGNALLLYLILVRIVKNNILAWGSAMLFSVNSTAYQPMTWVAAGIGTMPGTFFLLLFIFFLVLFGQTKKSIYALIAYTSIVVSILFKETSIFIFPFIPLVFFGIKRVYKAKLQVNRRWVLSFFILGALYVALRVLLLLIPLRSAQPEVGDLATASIGTYVYRLISVSPKAFSQAVIPFWILRLFSNGIAHLGYPQFIESDGVANPYIVESILFDFVCLAASALLLLLSFFAYRRLRKQNVRMAHVLLISLLFIGTSALPYIFIPGRAGFFSIFEPRDLYVVSIGTSVWLSLMLYTLRKRFLFTVIIILLFIFHSLAIQQDIEKLIGIGRIRKNMLTTIHAAYPRLPQNVVFFTQSDRSYYGLPAEEKILPLQSGLGRMLLVWYQDSEQFSGCFYENAYLHGIKAEGYKNCDGRGLGYFSHYDALLNSLKKNNLSPRDIISYRWKSRSGTFIDISQEIRSKLFSDLQ